MKIIVGIIPTDLVANSLLSFTTIQKQESGFQQVGDLETRNISVFCLCALLQSHAKFNRLS